MKSGGKIWGTILTQLVLLVHGTGAESYVATCVCVCVCVFVLHSSLYSPLPGCLSVVYIILTPAQLPECGVQMAGEPVSSSLQSHPETLCLSAVRKSFFYPESASQHSLPSTQWRKCTLRLKLYMGMVDCESRISLSDSTCAVCGSSLQLLGYRKVLLFQHLDQILCSVGPGPFAPSPPGVFPDKSDIAPDLER